MKDWITGATQRSNHGHNWGRWGRNNEYSMMQFFDSSSYLACHDADGKYNMSRCYGTFKGKVKQRTPHESRGYLVSHLLSAFESSVSSSFDITDDVFAFIATFRLFDLVRQKIRSSVNLVSIKQLDGFERMLHLLEFGILLTGCGSTDARAGLPNRPLVGVLDAS